MRFDVLKRLMIENKWIIFAAIFFIFWKFFLINTLWNNGINYIETVDDVNIYLGHINSVINCPSLIFCNDSPYSMQNYSGYEHLFWRLPIGVFAKIFGLSAINAFYTSFYIGTVTLMFVLIYFLKALYRNDQVLVAFSVFFLALYNGAGSYHGFFWIVPSFFSLMFYFILLTILIHPIKNWWAYIALLILIPISLYTHTISLYLILTSVPFFLIYSLFVQEFKIDMFKKIIFIILIITIAYISVSIKIGGNPYGPEVYSSQTIQYISSGNTSSATKEIQKNNGFEKVRKDYFDWILPHWIFFFPILIIIFVLLYYGQFALLALSISSLLFTILSSITPDSVRSLILLWPVTFIFYASGIVLFYRFLSEKMCWKIPSTFSKIILLFVVAIFSFINIKYSYLANKNSSVTINQLIPSSLSEIISQK